MKTLHTVLIASSLSIGLSASAQSLPPKPESWGPAKKGVHVSLSLDKLTYALGESIPLHIVAQVSSAQRPVYGEPDGPTGAFLTEEDFSEAFHLTITDKNGRIVGDNAPSNLALLMGGGSSGASVCPAPLEVGRVYALELSANWRRKLLPTRPGTYRLTVLWSPYLASDPPCVASRGPVEAKELRPLATVSSVPITIHVTGNP